MNDKKFCFIMCVNDDQFEDEAIKYINRINIPEGYEIEQLSVKEAHSMTSGYNEAMRVSDAKYKIYMHQDVLILNRDILYRLLEIFSDDSIGIVGMVGTERLPESAVMWEDDRIGRIATCDVSRAGDCGFNLEYVAGRVREVEAVDGLFIATQYDVPWREDLFTGWDFYDVSQPFEMRKHGYKAVVPDMDEPWVLHDAGLVNMERYYTYRDIFLKEYKGKIVGTEPTEEYKKFRCEAREKTIIIDEILACGAEDRFKEIAKLFTPQFCQGAVSRDSSLLTLYVLMSVIEQHGFEDKERWFSDCYSLEAIVKRWDQIKFAMWEVEYEFGPEAENRLFELVTKYQISNELLKKLIDSSAIDDKKVYMLLACIFMDHGDVERGEWMLAAGKIEV